MELLSTYPVETFVQTGSSSSRLATGTGVRTSLTSTTSDLQSTTESELRTRVKHLEVLYQLSTDVVAAGDRETVYTAALDAVIAGLGAHRASLLLFDADGVLRFKATDGLSEAYRNAVEGHTPWTPDTPNPQPILVSDAEQEASLDPYRDVIRKEGIRSLAFVPLRHEGRVLGKFMAYFDVPHVFTVDEIRLAEMIANHLAVVIARRASEDAREALYAQREAERAQLDAIVRQMPVGVAIVQGTSEEPVLRNPLADNLWPLVEHGLTAPEGVLPRVISGGEVVLDAEVPYDRQDGSRGFVSVSGSPVYTEDGRVASGVIVLEEASARKKGESALRFLADATYTLAESLDYESTLQKVAELMVPEFADWCNFDLVTDEGEIQLVSLVHSKPERTALARTLRESYPPRLDAPTGIGQVIRTKEPIFIPEITGEMLEATAQGPAHLEQLQKLQLRSGMILPLIARGRVLGTLTLIMAESGRAYDESYLPYVEELAQSCALAVDNARLYDEARRELSERQKVEEALRNSEERYRMLSEATTDYIFSYSRGADGTFKLEWVSEAFERITGYTSADIFDAGSSQLTVHPEDTAIVAAFTEHMRKGERHVMEHRLIRKDGSLAWVRIYGRPVIDAETNEVTRVLGAGQDITARKSAEQALHELANSLERRIEERTRALATANQRLRSEVQDRSHAEEQLARANEALRTSNRELQDFAYVASHDLQEPLRKIQSFADLLRTDYGPRLDDQGRFYIERMQSAASRMSDLIKGLLTYSRVRTQGLPFQPVDLNEVVRDVLSDLEITISETRGAVSVQPMPTVEADPTQMRQLFQNLIGNALKFRDPERAPVVRITGRTEDGQCRIEISDNGIGFAAQYVDRIFSPFQRLHGRTAYPGTGMGLAICRRIVERHAGAISATAQPSEGAAFQISLPLRQEPWNGDKNGLLTANGS